METNFKAYFQFKQVQFMKLAPQMAFTTGCAVKQANKEIQTAFMYSFDQRPLVGTDEFTATGDSQSATLLTHCVEHN